MTEGNNANPAAGKGGRGNALCFFAAFAALWFGFISPARATCINPVGDHGDMLYNLDHTVMQYCNGTYWVSMDASKSGGSDNLGNHTATKDLDMADFKIKNVAIPTSSADATNKAYVDAAVASAAGEGEHNSSGGQPLYWYQTPGVYTAQAARSACSPGYKLCILGEWFGRPYNYTLGGSYNFDAASGGTYYSWFGTSYNQCTTSGYAPAMYFYAGSNNTGSTAQAYGLSCSTQVPALCCQLPDQGGVPQAGVYSSLVTLTNGPYYWGDVVQSSDILPNNFTTATTASVTGVGAELQTVSAASAASAWAATLTINPGDKIRLRATTTSSKQSAVLSIAGTNYAWDIPQSDPITSDITTAGALTNATTVTGITSATPAIVTGSGSVRLKVNNGSWVTAATVNPGDTVQLQAARTAAEQTLIFTYGTVSNYWKLSGATAYGRMIMTFTTYNGNLGGLTGANQKCYDELKTYGWKDKEITTIRPSNVKAFLCDGTKCNGLPPSTPFLAAEANYSGGGSQPFTTDANGLGPNNAAGWYSYFYDHYYNLSNRRYWSGRGTNSTSQWSNTPTASHCGNWGSTSGSGSVGDISSTGKDRWEYSSGQACTGPLPLMCYILPQ